MYLKIIVNEIRSTQANPGAVFLEPEGMIFLAVLARNGVSILAILVPNRV